jgi:hypothetical protein
MVDPKDPCASSDRDGDGFGTDDACPQKDCDDSNIGVRPGAPEACNALDDDCDQEVDEELGEGSCGAGPCRRTAPFCENGRPSVCTPAAGSPEICNGQDDDCDGTPDDGLSGESCGVGACARSSTCENGSFTPCTPGPPAGESCNRVDDDCDGVLDNGFRAAVDNGTYTTLAMFHSSCDGSGERMGPSCNAAMHRYCAQRGCSTSGFGPLENSGDIAIVGCVTADPAIDVPYAELATHHPPCDGTNQRIGPDCNAAIHRYCASKGYASGYGPVEGGSSSALIVCLSTAQATVVGTTYTVLMTHHDGCTAGTRIGPACNAAINRFCASTGHTTGYGPVENFGDGATVTCVRP